MFGFKRFYVENELLINDAPLEPGQSDTNSYLKVLAKQGADI